MREAGNSNHVRTARSSADTLFVSFHDNASFTAADNPAWPEDDTLTPDNESYFTLTSIWGDNDWIDDNGSYHCRLTGIDTAIPSFTINTDCHEDEGVTTAVLEDGVVSVLPSVILIGGSEPCIVSAVSASGGDTDFTVADQNCLTDQNNAALRTDSSSGSGVIFPRFVSKGSGKASILTSTYFDHFGVDRDSAGLYFGVEEIYRDTASSQSLITSDRSDDNFSAGWVNIDNFNEVDTLAIVNPRQQSSFTLFVEAVSSGTSIARDNAGTTAETPLYRGNLTLASLRTLLNSLHVNAPGATDVTLRFHLGSGDMVWQRDLKLSLD